MISRILVGAILLWRPAGDKIKPKYLWFAVAIIVVQPQGPSGCYDTLYYARIRWRSENLTQRA